MITEATLLKLFLSSRNICDNFQTYVKYDALSVEAGTILRDIRHYSEALEPSFPIDIGKFQTWFLQLQHPELNEDARKTYLLIFERLEDEEIENDDTFTKEVLNHFRSEYTKDRIRQILSDKGLDTTSITKELDDFKLNSKVLGEQDFVVNNFADVFVQQQRSQGLKWRLDCLNKSIGPLIAGDFGYVAAYVDTGKCLGKGTKVLMYDGSRKNVEDVQVGDQLRGDDDTPRTVLSLARGTEQLYKIIQNNGDDYVVNQSHILTLIQGENKRRYKDLPPMTKVDIPLEEYLEYSATKKAALKGIKAAVDYPFQSLPCDAYFLGVWLGDGHSNDTCITNADPAIISYLQDYALYLGYHFVDYETTNTGAASTYNIVNKQGQANNLRDALRELGVFNNKHIPKIVLQNTRVVRKAVLAGLLDTDGHYSKGMYEITQSRKELAEGILDLVRSLGFLATLRSKIIDGKPYYRITFSGNTWDFPLKRLAKRADTEKRNGPWYGIKVEKLSVGDYYGFTIDGNHRFLLGDYTITHNTKFLVSEVAHMAQQITDGSVLWFNNEGPEDRIQSQLLCAVLDRNEDIIKENLELAQQRYAEKMNGDVDRIKIFDAVGYNPAMIREKAEKYNAKLIVIDMLDHLVLPGGSKTQEVIRLKNLYRDIRDISKDFCPVLGSSQCDGTVTWTDRTTGDAKFQHYIGMHQLDFSRSAKQAAAEFIITIGRDPEYPMTRYIHVPKNKLSGDGSGLSRNIKSEVSFNGERSIYY